MHSCAPTYPTKALRAKEQGTVKIRFDVDPEGKFISADITQSSGSADLDRAAVNALTRCVYTPKLVDGKPTETSFSVTYIWKLPRS
ncbi:MAG TPA: energy transducer TonB [Burkholderiaceae bacterium]